jgi:phosphoribosyl 1,2-cyclic phosphodiesterase
MPLYIASINSGSNGNCYYVGNHRDAVLIDAGISCRETERRMTRQGLTMNKVRSIFISHEHTDHTGGLEVIARRYQIPVYISESSYRNSRLNLDTSLIRPISAYSPVTIGELTINPFPKKHDSSDPYSFTVSGEGITIGILTDIGEACEHVIQNFRQCHAAFLEANYDEAMLDQGRYPLFLKRRIRGDHGHLSNRQSLELFREHRPEFMSHLLLSHLSRDNNSPQLVRELFEEHAGGTVISIASRDEESAVYCIDGTWKADPSARGVGRREQADQLKLF